MDSVRHIFRTFVLGVFVLMAGSGAILPVRQVNASTSWYVTASGSDVPDCGSSGAPCRSIVYILNFVSGFTDGDTINVSGVLSENVSISRAAVIVGQTSDATLEAGGADSVVSVSEGVSVTLMGLTIRGGQASNGGGIRNQGTLIASRVVITGNRATITGGGIYNAGALTMTHSKVADNWVVNPDGAGGGIENVGVLSLSDVVIEHNKGGAYGGGIDNFGGQTSLTRVVIRKNEAASGAGIDSSNNGTLVVESSAIAENIASNQGGGISNSGALTLSNVTLSRNLLLAGPGAGLFNTSPFANASLNFVSVVSNTTANAFNAEASGLYTDLSGKIALTATVIAYNTARNCVAVHSGSFQSFNYNVSSDDQCSFLTQPQDAVNVDPQLGALKFNNGTYTHGPMRGSVLLDVVDPASCPPMDQRSVTRPQGSRCDVGAHEATAAELNSADLELAAEAPLSVSRSTNFTLTLQVKNLGPNAAQSPVVTVTMPAGVQFTSAAGTNWSCSLSGIAVECNYQDALMPVGVAPSIIVLLVAPHAEMKLQTTSIVWTLSPDPNMNNNVSTVTSSVIIKNPKAYVPVVQR